MSRAQPDLKIIGNAFEAEKISLAMIEEKSEESQYWQSVHTFCTDNWSATWDALTPKQLNWMQKILEDLVEQRIEGRL